MAGVVVAAAAAAAAVPPPTPPTPRATGAISSPRGVEDPRLTGLPSESDQTGRSSGPGACLEEEEEDDEVVEVEVVR